MTKVTNVFSQNSDKHSERGECGGPAEDVADAWRGFRNTGSTPTRICGKVSDLRWGKTDEARRRGGGGGVRQVGDPQGGAGNRGTGSDVIDSIPGRRNSGNHIPGMPVLARIHYNLPYMKY